MIITRSEWMKWLKSKPKDNGIAVKTMDFRWYKESGLDVTKFIYINDNLSSIRLYFENNQGDYVCE